MRAKFSAITQETPAPRRAIGACSREEPQPKFAFATITSPARTILAKFGSRSSIACLPNSSAVFAVR